VSILRSEDAADLSRSVKWARGRDCRKVTMARIVASRPTPQRVAPAHPRFRSRKTPRFAVGMTITPTVAARAEGHAVAAP